MRNIWYKNITMKNVRYPIFITSYYPKTPKGPGEDFPAGSTPQNPQWTDITIEDVTITDSSNSIIFIGPVDGRWGVNRPANPQPLLRRTVHCTIGL